MNFLFSLFNQKTQSPASSSPYNVKRVERKGKERKQINFKHGVGYNECYSMVGMEEMDKRRTPLNCQKDGDARTRIIIQNGKSRAPCKVKLEFLY